MTDAASASPAPSADTATPGVDDDLRDLPDVSLDEIKVQLAELGLTPGQLKGRLIASRRWEDRAKAKDPEFLQFKAEAEEFARFKDASRSQQQIDVDNAKAEGKAAALQEAAPELVASAFDAAAARAGLTDEQVTALLEDLAVVNFLTADGKVDRAKVAAKVAAFAPAAIIRPPVSLGQGRTSTEVKPSVASGRELYEQSRSKRKTA